METERENNKKYKDGIVKSRLLTLFILIVLVSFDRF
jgi:hypothetical protein